jgi:hypothetical protein
MPLRLFAGRERAGAYAARLLFLAAMAPFWFFITQYPQGVDGYSPVKAGLVFLPTTLVNFAAVMVVPGSTRRYRVSGWRDHYYRWRPRPDQRVGVLGLRHCGPDVGVEVEDVLWVVAALELGKA